MRLIYLIGPPGVGKTSTVRAALGDPDRVFTDPFAHCYHYESSIFELGYPRSWYGGTDALPMNVMPRVTRWFDALSDSPYLTVGEGDRLASRLFFDEIPDLEVIYLTGPHQRRRLARGEPQDPTWVKGRITKCERLAERYGARVLDTDRPLDEVARDLSSMLVSFSDR
jgi:hypothetical protein